MTATCASHQPLADTTKRHHTNFNSNNLPSLIFLEYFIIFKHIAKGRSANNTFAKSLKSSIFNFSCIAH